MNNVLVKSRLFFVVLLSVPVFFAEAQTFTFSNPVLRKGADPWIIQKDGMFYYCHSANGAVHVKAAKYVHEMKDATEVATWTPPEGQPYSKELWAPELHFIENRWYIYVAADDGVNAHHRMYVLRSRDADIKNGFEFVGKIATREDKWAIDGTVLEWNSKRYFIWSGWEGDINVAQHIYIARMDSPISISSDRVLLSAPEYDWEKRGSSRELPTINEGPQILKNAESVFLIYSAAGSWSNFYCLGQLTFTGQDPLDPAAWTKSKTPVFESTSTVFSPGHCSFLNINGQDWIVYHTAVQKDAGWNRKVKMQPFSWRNGEPDFGKPLDDGVKLTIKY